MNFICKLDKNIYKCISEDIISDEIIITDERLQHIKDRHYDINNELIGKMKTALKNPDYIIRDKKYATGLVIKKLSNGKEIIQIVLRIHTSNDEMNYKNSVISCWFISHERLNNYLRNKEILYKRE